MRSPGAKAPWLIRVARSPWAESCARMSRLACSPIETRGANPAHGATTAKPSPKARSWARRGAPPRRAAANAETPAVSRLELRANPLHHLGVRGVLDHAGHHVGVLLDQVGASFAAVMLQNLVQPYVGSLTVHKVLCGVHSRLNARAADRGLTRLEDELAPLTVDDRHGRLSPRLGRLTGIIAVEQSLNRKMRERDRAQR